MDVLHFLKDRHDHIRRQFTAINGSGPKTIPAVAEAVLLRDLQILLKLEVDYLYPEIADLFPGSSALIAKHQSEGGKIFKIMLLLEKSANSPQAHPERLGEVWQDLQTATLKHFDDGEQVLMPKMRSMIRTEDREDLGQVFADAQAELLATADQSKAPFPGSAAKTGVARGAGHYA